MYYSGYTEAQLNTALQLLVEIMVQPGFDETFVYKFVISLWLFAIVLNPSLQKISEQTIPQSVDRE